MYLKVPDVSVIKHTSAVVRRQVPLWVLSLTLGVVAFSVPSRAADDAGWFQGEMAFELHNDWTTKSGDPANERNDANLKVETTLEAALAEAFKIKSLLVFEPLRDPDPGKDRFFQDEGLYAEEIFAEFERGAFALRGGKFGQKFGIAWDAAPGIWGTDFAEDYELAEQIGIAADVKFGGKKQGEHVFTFGTFFADTTFLSESAITGRGRARKSDGGAGNTEDFSSFSVALEGMNIPVLGGLCYHAAYLHRGVDVPGETEESGVVGAVSVKFPLDMIEVIPLIEYAAFDDRKGMPGTDAHYLTTSLGFELSSWNLAVSRTARTIKTAGAPDTDDTLFQISGGYTFGNGISVDIGWRATEESGVDSDTLGLLVASTLKL